MHRMRLTIPINSHAQNDISSDAIQQATFSQPLTTHLTMTRAGND